jgi:hypothetical protein
MAAMSLACDTAMALPLETGLAVCLVSMELAYWWRSSSGWTIRPISSGMTGAADSWSGWSRPGHDLAKIWQTP